MNTLETAIQAALAHKGEDSPSVNKAYLEFLKANFIIPIEAQSAEPQVLFLQDAQGTFLPVFSEESIFLSWGAEVAPDIARLVVSGVDLLAGLGDNVSILLNIGAPSYKVFNPMELARLRNMAQKIFRKAT